MDVSERAENRESDSSCDTCRQRQDRAENSSDFASSDSESYQANLVTRQQTREGTQLIEIRKKRSRVSRSSALTSQKASGSKYSGQKVSKICSKNKSTRSPPKNNAGEEPEPPNLFGIRNEMSLLQAPESPR